MNFRKMVEDSDPNKPLSIPVNKFMIKNKGSLVKISAFYTDFYNDLLEKWGLKCTETNFVQIETSPEVKANNWDWFAYKGIDDFARIKFNFSVRAFRITSDTVMGIFSINYELEIDYKKTWRSNSFTKYFFPLYLRTIYQPKLLTFIGIYIEELNLIKEKLMERLNMSVYD